jgi:hypothetical protein
LQENKQLKDVIFPVSVVGVADRGYRSFETATPGIFFKRVEEAQTLGVSRTV